MEPVGCYGFRPLPMMRPLYVLLLLCISSAMLKAQPYRYDADHLPASFFSRNRENLLDRLPDSSACVLFSAPLRNRSNDVYYEFHQDPDFFYLTGFDAPDAVLLLFKPALKSSDGTLIRERLVIHPRDPGKERWTGRMATTVDAKTISGIPQVVLSSDTGLFSDLFSGNYRVLTKRLPQGAVNSRDDEFDLYDLLKEFKERSAVAGSTADDFQLPRQLARLREIKSGEELVLLKKAVDISVDGHLEMINATAPGLFEYSVEAAGEFAFRRAGAEDVGYPSICGSAENAVILHYEKNRRILKAGELLLLDMGAEYHGYSADITRTIPVSGRFSPEQHELYSLVLAAQTAGIEACRAGNRFRAPHEAALKVIESGLLRLGIIRDEAAAKDYFPHGTSHYLGLDVHDPGSFEPLRVNQVITVEPGIYIPAGSPCESKWWNIGIRIEDDVLITSGNPEVLSGRLPKDPDELEKMMTSDK